MKNKKFIINLAAKKTEEQWEDTFDAFFLTAVPILFKWTSWSILLGGLTYIQKVTSSIELIWVIAVLSAGFVCHVASHLFRILVVWRPEMATDDRPILKRESFASVIFILLLAGAFYYVGNGTKEAILQFQGLEQPEINTQDLEVPVEG